MEATTETTRLLREVALNRFQATDNKAWLVFEDEDSKLYIGSVGAARNRTTLLENKVTHIVCLVESIGAVFQEDDQLEYIVVRDMKDSPKHDLIGDCKDLIFPFMEAAIQSNQQRLVLHEAMLKEKPGFLIHCMQDMVRHVRPQAQPNLGFAAQLRLFEKQQREKECLLLDTKDEIETAGMRCDTSSSTGDT